LETSNIIKGNKKSLFTTIRYKPSCLNNSAWSGAFPNHVLTITLFLNATEAVFALRDTDSASGPGPDDKRLARASVSKRPRSIEGKAKSAMLRMKLVGAKSDAQIQGEEALVGKVNYLTGSDKSKWHTDIPTYGQVRYDEVWPGVDMLWHGNNRQPEYDFIVAPTTAPSAIRISFAGAESLSLDKTGNLLLKTRVGTLTQKAPEIYQETASGRHTVAGRYVLLSEQEVGFEVGAYDTSAPLTIDPQLLYATFYGGTGRDSIEDIAVDNSGNAYVTGFTLSSDLVLENPFQSSLNSSAEDAFVVKLNPAGTDIVYATYLGGSDSASASSIAVTSDGRACVTGNTDNSGNTGNFPITPSAYQDNGSNLGDRNVDAFVTMLTAEGNGLVYSTFLGGNDSDGANGIAVDPGNRIYVVGETFSNNFPTKNAFQRNPGGRGQHRDAFVAKFDPSQSGNSSLVYSSFLGGDGGSAIGTFGRDIAATAAGVAFVVGQTDSTDFPVKSSSSLPPFQASRSGVTDGFVAKVSPTGSLIYATYFGGNGDDVINGIAVDSVERAYVIGTTFANGSTFPLKNAFDSTRNGADAFVAKFNADGTALFYSTFLGGTSSENGNGIAIDSAGDAYVTGTGARAGFPIVNGFSPSLSTGAFGSFIAKIEPSDATGTTTPKLLYSDMFGSGTTSLAVALDAKGEVFLAGAVVANNDFHATAGSFQQALKGTEDGVVLKVSSTFPDTTGVFRASTGQFLLRNDNADGPPDITVPFGQIGDQPVAGDWNGDGVDDVGVFRPSTGQFLLRRVGISIICNPTCHVGGGTIIVTLNFGQNGDLAVAGDWDGDGIDTPGVFRPSTGQWFLTNGPNTNNTSPPAAFVFNFGQAGDLPLAGDFDGNGKDGVGVFRPSTGQFFLDNNNLANTADLVFNFGANGDLPIAGDWNGDGKDGVAVFRPSTGQVFLNDFNTTNGQTGLFNFGQLGDVPVGDDWDGKP
jgi:hypothetical protein